MKTFSLALTHDEALVLYEWLASLDDKPHASPDDAEQTILWRLEGQLESQLPEVLMPDYAQRLAEAKQRLRIAGTH